MFRLEQTVGDTKYTCSLEVFADRKIEIIIKTRTPYTEEVDMGGKEKTQIIAKGKYFKVQMLHTGEVSSEARFARMTISYTEGGAEYGVGRDKPGTMPPPGSIKEVVETLRPFEASIKSECGDKVHATIFAQR